MKHHVGIIIVNYLGTKDTLECLNSLNSVNTKHNLNFYIVHYDNQTNLTPIKNHSLKPQITSVTDNLGFSGFNNLGIKQAIISGCDTLVLLNNDTTVDPGFIDPLVNQAHQKGVGLVSPKIYFYRGNETHKYPHKHIGKVIWYAGGSIDWRNIYGFHQGVDEVDRGQFNKEATTDFATGCCIALSKQTLDKIGYLDESYFLYYEDVDWSIRCQNNNMSILFEPTSTIYHKNAGSTGGSGSDTHLYYQTRNRIRFALRHAPLKSKLAVIKQSLNVYSSSSVTYKQAVKDALFGKKGIRQP